MIHLNASRESQHYNIQYENSFRYSKVVNITFNCINKLLAFLTIKLLQALVRLIKKANNQKQLNIQYWYYTNKLDSKNMVQKNYEYSTIQYKYNKKLKKIC